MDSAPGAAEHDPRSFGAWLRRSRELRGLSLDEVLAATRLPLRIVAALEDDDTSAMPDRAYALQFVRAVALAVGLDAEEAALRYEEWLLLLPPATLPPPLSPPTPLQRMVARARRLLRVPGRISRDPLKWLVVALTAAAIIAVLLRH